MKWGIGIVILAIVLVGGYFGAKAVKRAMAPSPMMQQHPMIPSSTVSPTAMVSPAAMQQITVTGNEFSFNPSTITVKAGQQVQVIFKNTGQYPHNFTLADLNVQTKTIQPGQQDMVTFTPTKTGSFTYICTVPGHADRGMKGTLTVQ